MPIKLKGQTLKQWNKWLTEQLAPPVARALAEPQVKYVVEAFQELIKQNLKTNGRKAL